MKPHQEPLPPPLPARTPRNPWPWVVAILGITLMIVGAGLYVFHSLRQIPGEIAAGGRELVGEIGELARAFNERRVERLFQSYATRVEGTTYLQVATLEQTEIYELREEASTLWGALELPAVAVRAVAPVEYTYYVDLAGDWRLELRDRRVLVLTPGLRFNKPNIDASGIRYEIRQGSLLRDERQVALQLKRELTGRSAAEAKRNVPVVRETARRQVEEFVQRWLLQSFADAGAYSVEVFFADEAPAFERALTGEPMPLARSPRG